jgi:hypothetical protein
MKNRTKIGKGPWTSICKDEVGTGRHPQREIISPLEVSQDYLLITPPSHFRLQKLGGWVGRFL